MASDFSHDETFFNGSVLDLSLTPLDDNEFIIATQDVGNEKKTSKALKHPNPDSKKMPETELSRKEDLESTKNGTKKASRASKTKREPLKVLNHKGKTSEDDPKKKNEVNNNSKNDSSQGKAVGKGTPKIVIFPKGSGKAKVQKKQMPAPKLGSGATSGPKVRRSLREGKSPNLEVPDAGKARHSLDDISVAKIQTKNKKSAGEGKKTPEKPEFKTAESEFNEACAKLETLFPNADPDFMKLQLVRFKGSLTRTVQYLNKREKENGVPAKNGYSRGERIEEIQMIFKENFTVGDLLLMFPNPWEYFSKEREKSSSYLKSSIHYLKNKHRKHFIQAIQEALERNKNSLYLADKDLSRENRLLKMRSTMRSKYECDSSKPTIFDIQFMYEVVFIENENEIKSRWKKAETARHKKFKGEKEERLPECLYCSNFCLLQDDTVNCPAHHVFCKDCLIKHVKIDMEKNNFKFKCLVKCEESFSVETLQRLLRPSVLDNIIERNKLEEIKPEGIENLVHCPFCSNIFITSAEARDIICTNPTCMRESCRKCKKASHVPWNCNEANLYQAGPLEIKEEEQIEVGNGENEEDLSVTLTSCGEIFKTDETGSLFGGAELSPLNYQQDHRSTRSRSYSSASTEYTGDERR